ncbi:MAG TPA: FkbM family methyltransferase [Thermoguttaceae bacterium]|nr:FkbM family methyltransferase [Thermoguttaceae bacterium]
MNHPGEFLDHLLTQFLVKVHERTENNYDAMRFSYDGVDRSSQYNVTEHKNYLRFLMNHHEALYRAYCLLEDEPSRKTFLDLILFRLVGHLHMKLDTNNAAHWDLRDRARRMDCVPSTITYTGLFGPLRHYENVSFDGEMLNVDCWQGSIVWSFLIRQYYLERNGTAVRPEPGDYVIDAGACFGDTSLAFACSVGPQGRVFAFEVLGTHLDIIRHNVAQNPALADRIVLVPYGLADRCNPSAQPIQTNGVLAPGFSLQSMPDEASIPVTTIDRLVESGDIERVDFIKMDIEGYELKALRGATRTLCRFRPKLAISVYHRAADLYEIPTFLSRLGLGYKLFIEHYTIHAEETILYAIAPKDSSMSSDC